MTATEPAWTRIGSNARATAHIARRSGEGWKTQCGRWTAFEPLPAPDTARRCSQCAVGPLDADSPKRIKFGRPRWEPPRA